MTYSFCLDEEIELERYGLEWMSKKGMEQQDQSLKNWIGLEQQDRHFLRHLGTKELDWSSLVWSGIDWNGLGLTRMDWFGSTGSTFPME